MLGGLRELLHYVERLLHRFNVARLMTDHVKDIPNYELTERYMAELEEIIQRQPHLWLWSHRRWKRQRHADGTFYEEPKE